MLRNYTNTRKIFVKYQQVNIINALNEFYETDIDKKYDIFDLIDIINDSSNVFRKLPNNWNVYDKINTCKLTIKSIEHCFYKKYKKSITCDDLLPILTLVLILNYDIFFSVDIQLIYNHFRDSSNMEGYISTLMMSALDMFIEFTNRYRKGKLAIMN